MNKLFACLPCYNEEENINPLVRAWLAQQQKLAVAGFQLEVVAIDDKSTDHTRQKIEQLAAQHPQVTLVAHKGEQGTWAAA